MTESVRLMLDEMFPPSIADTLSKDHSIDVVAVSGDPALRGLPDEQLLERATMERRCLVTENVSDFERLRRAWTDEGRAVAGLLYVSARRFPRTPGGALKIADALLTHAERERIPGQGAADWLTSS